MNNIDEPRVLLFCLLELERWTLEDPDGVVLTAGDDAERTRRAEVAAVDRLRLSADLTDGSSRVSHENMTETFASFTNDNDSLTVSRPRDVFNGSADRLELVLQQVLFVHRVPNANLSRCITTGCEINFPFIGKFLSDDSRLTDVKARRRIFGNVYSTGMLGVHISNSWILKIVAQISFSSSQR